MDKRLNELVIWLNAREERERIAILAGSCIIFSMLWYLVFEKPLMLDRLSIQQQTVRVQKQTLLLQNESNGILINTAKAKQQEKTNVQENAKFQTLNLHFASPEGNDTLVKAILSPVKSVKIMDLKSITAAAPEQVKPVNAKLSAAATTTTTTITAPVAPTKDGFQIVFESDYMNTLAYLNALEKLPWCLSWDSLEYSVKTYPIASVVVSLHIVSA
jgi:hypothetical protein